MLKYFCSSDIHSFYTKWITALNEAGFDKNNPEHIILICGDLFDRGPESVECFNFVKNMADKDRLVYVRGNHEDLLKHAMSQLLTGRVSDHHWSNGTIKTISHITETNDVMYLGHDPKGFTEKLNKLIDFIDEHSVDYFELGETVFVHGWLPTTSDNEGYMIVHENWRDGDWDEARWENGMEMFKFCICPEDMSTIVCGHWHSSYGHANITKVCSEFNTDAIFTPFIYTKEDKTIVAMDACTVHSGFVNVIIFDEHGKII